MEKLCLILFCVFCLILVLHPALILACLKTCAAGICVVLAALCIKVLLSLAVVLIISSSLAYAGYNLHATIMDIPNKLVIWGLEITSPQKEDEQ